MQEARVAVTRPLFLLASVVGQSTLCFGYEGLSETATNGVQAMTGAPPRIVHGVLELFEEHAFSGYIDPRMETDNGADLNLGLDEFTLVFSEEVRDLGSGQEGRLTAGAFSVTQTGLGAPPNIKGIEESVETDGRHHVTIVLDRIITLQKWTTIRADVEDLDGVPISNLGDLGPELDELDRIDVGFLPGDVDQNGRVTPRDLIWLRQMLSGIREPDKGNAGDYIDIDRDGVWPEPQDLLRFRQSIFGVPPCVPPGGVRLGRGADEFPPALISPDTLRAGPAASRCSTSRRLVIRWRHVLARQDGRSWCALGSPLRGLGGIAHDIVEFGEQPRDFLASRMPRAKSGCQQGMRPK
jgi:hypothetical protein